MSVFNQVLRDPRFEALDNEKRRRALSLALDEDLAADPRSQSVSYEELNAAKEAYLDEVFSSQRPARVSPGYATRMSDIETAVDAKPSKGRLSDLGRGLAAGTLMVPESIGTTMEWLGHRTGSEMLQEVGRTTSEYWGEKVRDLGPPAEIAGKNIIDDREILREGAYWFYNVGQIVPSLAAAIIPGMAAHRLLSMGPKVIAGMARLGQWVASGATGGALESSSTYKALREDGESEPMAARAAELMFFGTVALNAFATDKLLRAAGDTFKKKVLKRLGAAVWEGITEGLEEPWEVISILASKYINDEPMPDDIQGMFLESMKEGATIALPAGLTGAGMGGGRRATTSLTPEIQSELDALSHEELAQLKESGMVKKGSEIERHVDQLLSRPAPRPPLDMLQESLANGEISIDEVQKSREQFEELGIDPKDL